MRYQRLSYPPSPTMPGIEKTTKLNSFLRVLLPGGIGCVTIFLGGGSEIVCRHCLPNQNLRNARLKDILCVFRGSGREQLPENEKTPTAVSYFARREILAQTKVEDRSCIRYTTRSSKRTAASKDPPGRYEKTPSVKFGWRYFQRELFQAIRPACSAAGSCCSSCGQQYSCAEYPW